MHGAQCGEGEAGCHWVIHAAVVLDAVHGAVRSARPLNVSDDDHHLMNPSIGNLLHGSEDPYIQGGGSRYADWMKRLPRSHSAFASSDWYAYNRLSR